MEENYEVYGYSVPNFGKEQNGDNFLHQFLVDENILVAIVADGVSKQPCDWLASQTTCNKVWEFFQQNQSEQEIGKRLQQSVLQANEFIVSVEGACKRMASTLSAFVWPINGDTYWIANIGDSRIYSSYEGKLELLTRDDANPFKERVLAHGGVRVINKTVLNKVMGMDSLKVSVTQKLFREGEVVLLASDGFYDSRKAIFSQTMAELSEKGNFQEHFQMIVKQFEIMRGDDFTAVMIKKTN